MYVFVLRACMGVRAWGGRGALGMYEFVFTCVYAWISVLCVRMCGHGCVCPHAHVGGCADEGCSLTAPDRLEEKYLSNANKAGAHDLDPAVLIHR